MKSKTDPNSRWDTENNAVLTVPLAGNLLNFVGVKSNRAVIERDSRWVGTLEKSLNHLGSFKNKKLIPSHANALLAGERDSWLPISLINSENHAFPTAIERFSEIPATTRRTGSRYRRLGGRLTRAKWSRLSMVSIVTPPRTALRSRSATTRWVWNILWKNTKNKQSHGN